MLNPQAIPNSDGDGSCQVPLPCLEELWLGGVIGQVFGLLHWLEYSQKIGTLLLNLFPCCRHFTNNQALLARLPLMLW